MMEEEKKGSPFSWAAVVCVALLVVPFFGWMGGSLLAGQAGRRMRGEAYARPMVPREVVLEKEFKGQWGMSRAAFCVVTFVLPVLGAGVVTLAGRRRWGKAALAAFVGFLVVWLGVSWGVAKGLGLMNGGAELWWFNWVVWSGCGLVPASTVLTVLAYRRAERIRHIALAGTLLGLCFVGCVLLLAWGMSKS